VLPGSFDNELDVLVNDGLVTESIAAYRLKEPFLGPASARATLTTNARRHPPGLHAGRPGSSASTGWPISPWTRRAAPATGQGSIIAVGKLDVAPDFYKVAATTNPGARSLLDVLANDRLHAQPVRGSLTLLSVNAFRPRPPTGPCPWVGGG
jgi:hypothetical protein